MVGRADMDRIRIGANKPLHIALDRRMAGFSCPGFQLRAQIVGNLNTSEVSSNSHSTTLNNRPAREYALSHEVENPSRNRRDDGSRILGRRASTDHSSRAQ